MSPRSRRPRRATTDPPSNRPSSNAPSEIASPSRDIVATARGLGLAVAAAGIIARFTWPGEARDEIGSGQGLPWVLAVLLGLTIALAASWIGGRLRLRWSWVDAAVVALFALVALSGGRAADSRVAINLAFEWLGVGLAYLAIRWLALTAAESRAWVAVLIATGFALSVYAVYQVGVLQPETRRLYLQDPTSALRQAGLPDDDASRRRFEDRLLGSREPTSTFALANSLAGALLVPLLATAGTALAAGRPGRRVERLAVVPLLLLMVPVFVLTKGRGAYVGLAVGVCILAVRGVADRRRLALVGLGVIAASVVIGLALSTLGRLDPLVWNSAVWSESAKSLRYRAEYFVGTWNVLNREPGVWWSGLGPGNFGGAYLRYKLEAASESIADPHNLFLEVWTTAGLPALVALLAALGLALRDLFAPLTLKADSTAVSLEPRPRLFAWGLGGMVLSQLLRPDLGLFAGSGNPLDGDLPRSVILLLGWFLGAWLAWRLVQEAEERTLIAALSAGFVALIINLLIAGGIGFAPVALGLWTAIAAALNLRGDRPCGLLREVGGRGGAIALLTIAAALGGLFFGTMIPHYRATQALDRAETQIARARQAMQSPVLEPYSRAEPYYRSAADFLREAARLDDRAATPWIRWAWLELENWEASGRPTDFAHLVWHRIEDQLAQAATPPRDPNNAAPSVAAMPIAARILAAPGWPATERERILGDRYRFAGTAARLNPTSAMVQASLAEAAWAAGANDEGDTAARRALDLDRQTPHVDKKLTNAVRARLEKKLDAGSKARY